MELLLFLLAGLAVLIVVPVLLLKLVVTLVLQPFRILGGVAHGVGVLVGLAFKAVFGVFGLLFGLLVGLVVLVALPLLPLLVVGGIVWLLARPSRRQPLGRLTA